MRGSRSPISAFEVRVLHESGIVGLLRPDKAAKVATTFLRWGASPATGIAIAAIHHGEATAIVDERGSLSFEQVHRRSNALAHAFERMGIGYGDGVGIMCRNHRGFIEATLAAAKLGASALYLNTMFAGPQLVEVTRREEPKALVYDEEFASLLDGVDEGIARIVAWTDGDPEGDDARLADRRQPRLRPQAAARQTPLRHPHLGHDRHAQGRPALQSRRLDGDGLADRQDPLPGARDDGDRGTALSLLGLLPLRDEPANRLDDGVAASLRSRGHFAGGR